MILDVLPSELMKEVMLDLSTVDIIQTVKCTRRLYHFAKADKALRRRLRNRIFNFCLRLGKNKVFADCGEPILCLYLDANFRETRGAMTRWRISSFIFWFEGGCKCGYGLTPKIEPGLLDHPSFLYDRHLLEAFDTGSRLIINNGSLDDAIINCGKLFNILMKFCVVRRLELVLYNSDDHKWDKMNAFFNANPPDLRIQPYVSIDSAINLDDFLTGSIFSNGLAEIRLYDKFGPVLLAPYHEVFRRTPSVSFFGMDLPYDYEDLLGFFKDTKELSLHSATHITKQQIRQLVQNFYEVEHDEECFFEIAINRSFLIKNFLTLVPKEAYRLHPKRSGIMNMDFDEPQIMTWAEMTDRFGGRWALMGMVVRYGCEMENDFLRICSMKYFTKHKLIKLYNKFDSDQSDSD